MRGFRRRVQAVLTSAAVALMFCALNCALAQGTAVGAIEGTVTDGAGSVIPGATVTVTDIDKNISHSVVAAGDGIYAIRDLEIGFYNVKVEKPGFKIGTYDHVQVAVGRQTTLDAKMTPGGGVENVVVQATGTGITTDSGDRSILIQAGDIAKLPLQVASGPRQDDTFITLSPGVVGNTFSARINGAPDFSQDFYYDGIPYMNADGGGRQEGATPSVEAIDQYGIITNAYTAEYGRGAGLLNFHIKSGTNQIHAAAWEYLRNNVLDSKGQFSKTAGTEKQHEYGFRAGGPVFIPKIYDGRDKTFIFGLYSWYKFRGGLSTSDQTLPTAQMITGDFSQLPFPIYDPATTRPDGRGGLTRDPFPGNIIPLSRLSPLSAQYLALMPTATLPGIVNNAVVRAPASPVNNTYWLIKIDHSITSKFVLHASYYRINEVIPSSPVIPGPLGSGNNFSGHFWEPRISLDQNFTPTVINSTNFSVQYTEGLRVFSPLVPSSFSSPIAKTGLPYPAIAINGFPTFGTGLDNNQNSGGCWPCAFISDIVRWQHGRHSLSFGGEFRWEDERDAFAINIGQYNFSNTQTSLPDAANPGALGYSFASFFLGDVNQASRSGEVDHRLVKTAYRSLFVQDDFKATPRLTVNLGLRWDYGVPVSDPKNRISSLGPTVPNPGAGGLPGSLIGAGKTGGACIADGGASLCKSRFSDPYYKSFQPRIGFAYAATPRTVLRGGFGIASIRSEAATLYGPAIAANYLAGYQYQDTLVSPDNGFSPPPQLSPTWDVGLPPIPPNPPLTRSSANGQGLQYMAPEDGKNGYSMLYSLTIERELPYRIAWETSYVGSGNVRIGGYLRHPNQVPAERLSLGPVLNADINSPEALAAGFTPPFPGFTGSVSQALRPFPQFTEINQWTQAHGHSTYNSLQVRAQKSTSEGLNFLVAYTWSKNITNGFDQFDFFGPSPLDQARPQLERQVLGANANAPNVPHVLSIASSYELPIGPGKHYLSHGGVAGRVAGGWAASALLTYLAGVPLPISGGSPNPIFNNTSRPNVVPGVPEKLYKSGKFHPATDVYLNGAAFSDAGPFALGNASPTLPHAPGFATYNENLSLIKTTQIAERLSFQLRCDAFNAFNRTVWGNPDTNFNDVSSGGFGKIGYQANSPRVIQFGVRLDY